jgi:hypothetical protein
MCSEAGFDYRYFALKAGQARITINAGYAARHDSAALEAYCAALEEDTARQRVREDSLYVVSDALVPLMRSAATPVTCARVDGFAVCAAASTVAAWDPTLDLRWHVLPPDAELQQFRMRLEGEYRDRMRRPEQPYRGSIAQRLQAMAGYLDLRVNGCTDQEAFERSVGTRPTDWDARLCPRQALDPERLPPVESVRSVRERLEAEWARRDEPMEPSCVDAEGEAVWLHAYLELRQRRQSPEQATAEVLATIRRIAP